MDNLPYEPGCGIPGFMPTCFCSMPVSVTTPLKNKTLVFKGLLNFKYRITELNFQHFLVAQRVTLQHTDRVERLLNIRWTVQLARRAQLVACHLSGLKSTIRKSSPSSITSKRGYGKLQERMQTHSAAGGSADVTKTLT